MYDFTLSNGDHYPRAALKNFLDAKVLLDQKRYDGAAYLAGYVAECVLKALICYDLFLQSGSAQPQYTHNLSQLSRDVANLITAGKPNFGKYVSLLQSYIPHGSPLAGWSETLRYRPEGTIDQATAERWFRASEDYKKVIEEMRKDGIIKDWPF